MEKIQNKKTPPCFIGAADVGVDEEKKAERARYVHLLWPPPTVRAQVFNTKIEMDLVGLYIGFGKVHGCGPAEPHEAVVTECTFERCYSVNKVPRKDTRTKSL